MADLDDFFAKKDRKKAKGKKFATADEIAKRLEETGRRTEKLKKEKQSSSTGQEVDEQGNTVQEEDEWREFEEEKKDYSGLKIQNLTLAEYDSLEEGGSGEGDEEGGMEENEAGEMVPRRKTGPWRVVSSAGGGAGAPTEAGDESAGPQEPAPEPAPAPPPPSTGSYVPPALRNQQKKQQTTLTPTNARLMRRKAAPDVKNEELFPTLSAASAQETTSVWSKKKGKEDVGFEEVRNSKSHSGRQAAAQVAVGLSNKYGALESEQS